MAMGARKALIAHHKEWSRLPFTGCDGLPEGGQRLVDKRVLAATVVVPSNAGPAVDVVARFLSGEPTPPQIVLSPRSYPPEDRLPRAPSGRRPLRGNPNAWPPSLP